MKTHVCHIMLMGTLGAWEHGNEPCSINQAPLFEVGERFKKCMLFHSLFALPVVFASVGFCVDEE